MKRLILLIFILSGAASLTAQQAEEDLITLKNGQQIAGEVVSVDSVGSVTMILAGQSQLTIPADQIVSRETRPARYEDLRQRRTREFSEFYFPRKGLYGGLMLGIGFPRIFTDEEFVPNDGGVIGLYLRGGYRISPSLNLGTSIGLQGMRGCTTLPLLAEVSGSMIGRKKGPVYLAQAGWGIPLTQNWWRNITYEGGPIAQVAVGWKEYTRSRLNWNILLGYRYQQITETQNAIGWGWGGVPDPDLVIGVPMVRHGLGFYLQTGVEF